MALEGQNLDHYDPGLSPLWFGHCLVSLKGDFPTISQVIVRVVIFTRVHTASIELTLNLYYAETAERIQWSTHQIIQISNNRVI